jgi:hypothetical protein
LGDRAGTCIDPKAQIVEGKTVCVVSCPAKPLSEVEGAELRSFMPLPPAFIAQLGTKAGHLASRWFELGVFMGHPRVGFAELRIAIAEERVRTGDRHAIMGDESKVVAHECVRVGERRALNEHHRPDIAFPSADVGDAFTTMRHDRGGVADEHMVLSLVDAKLAHGAAVTARSVVGLAHGEAKLAQGSATIAQPEGSDDDLQSLRSFEAIENGIAQSGARHASRLPEGWSEHVGQRMRPGEHRHVRDEQLPGYGPLFGVRHRVDCVGQLLRELARAELRFGSRLKNETPHVLLAVVDPKRRTEGHSALVRCADESLSSFELLGYQ